MNPIPKKVLIVEDEPSLSQAMARKLVERGYTTAEAHNGSEGLKVIQKSVPDLILLDQRMPIMDGMEMVEKLRDLRLQNEPKIIVVTNVDDQESVNRALQKGIHDYLVKSDLTLDQIADLVDRHMA